MIKQICIKQSRGTVRIKIRRVAYSNNYYAYDTVNHFYYSFLSSMLHVFGSK